MKKAVFVFAAVAAALLACTVEESVAPREPERVEATSPANVLRNAELAFNRRDIGLLKDMLSADFFFHFDPADVGRHPPERKYVIPEYWYCDEFWTAVDNMYILAYSISLAVPDESVGTPPESETAYRAENVPVSLRVMVDDVTGYVVDRGYCDYEFESFAGAGGKKYWRLTGWWDHTSVAEDELPGAEAASLGRVIASFR
jgi:hypothetical protein